MSKLRLIQCGVGGFGGGWVKDISSKSPDFELVAIVDLSATALASAGDAIGLPADKRFSSLQDALAKVSADAVLSVTPPAIHLEHARLAFAKGLHFITEKPIADNLENARTMLNLAEAAGKQLVVSQNYRYSASAVALAKIIADKTAGEFGHGHLDFYIPADFTGTFREAMEFPLLIDMAIHHMDLIRAVTGRNILRVTAHSFRPPWSWYKHEPGLKMILELDGGIPFSYSGDWSAKGRFTSWDGTWRLQCADGSVSWEDGKIAITRCEKWNKNLTIAYPDVSNPQFVGQAATLHSLATAIQSGKPAPTSGIDNINSFAVVMAAVISAKEHRTVDVQELIKSTK